MNTRTLAALIFIVGSAALVLPVQAAKQGSWSWREKKLIKEIPAPWQNHEAGPIQTPTPAQIAEAVAFGQAVKEKSTVLDYAYLFKAEDSAWSTDVIYVRVHTPLYLIARQAAEAARDYREPDDKFAQYAAGLGAVRVSVSQQYMSSRTFRSYAFHREVLLLRDGKRVPELESIAAWEGANPFILIEPGDPMAAAIATAQQIQRQYLGAENADKVSLNENSGTFPVEELLKPGHYELVLRAPATALLPKAADKEIRFPISFARYR